MNYIKINAITLLWFMSGAGFKLKDVTKIVNLLKCIYSINSGVLET